MFNQTFESAIHPINHYPPNKFNGNNCVIYWLELIYPPLEHIFSARAVRNIICTRRSIGRSDRYELTIKVARVFKIKKSEDNFVIDTVYFFIDQNQSTKRNSSFQTVISL